MLVTNIGKKFVAIIASLMFIFAITGCTHEQVTYEPETESYAEVQDVAVDTETESDVVIEDTDVAPEPEAPAVVEEVAPAPEPEPVVVRDTVHYVSAVYVPTLTQASVDYNDVVCAPDFGNALVAGHNYGSLGDIVNWRVGDEVYLNGIHLRVVTSNPAWLELRSNGPFADTVTDGVNELGDYPYQFYTCYGVGDGRWFVNAVAI